MASYQRVALYILFDAIEQDVVRNVRLAVPEKLDLSKEEREKLRDVCRGERMPDTTFLEDPGEGG